MTAGARLRSTPCLRGGQELRGRLRVAARQLEHESQIVPRVLVLRIDREDAAVCLDGAVEIAQRVAHDTQAVVGLEQVGPHPHDRLELGPGPRPVLLGDERGGQGQPRADEIGPRP